MPIACALMLTACAGSEADRLLATQAAVVATRPPLGRVDSRLTNPCPDPVALPDRALTQAEVETLWKSDRASLRFCKAKDTGVIRVYQARERVLLTGSAGT